MTGKRLVLVDGSGYIFRAFYGLPSMTRSDGTPVNAVYGFTKMLLKLCDDMSNDNIAVVFDAGRKTFRNDIFPEYKANRSDPPEELIPQFSLIREATSAIGLPTFELEGYEADDIIATFVKKAKSLKMKTLIVSSDKDLMQLVEDEVSLYDPMKNIYQGYEEVIEKFGVPPSLVVDVQSLAGDSSDNIPGVPGIGLKIAAQLINEYGSLDNLLEKASEISQIKRRENLINFSESAILSKKLVKLYQDVPLSVSIDNLNFEERDNQKLINFLRRNEFKSLENRISFDSTSKQNNNEQKQIELNYELITSQEELNKWIKKCKDSGIFAVDTETTSLNPLDARLVGISLSTNLGEACYIPLRHKEPEIELDLNQEEKKSREIKQLSFERTMVQLKDLFQDKSVLKIGHNIKYDMLVLLQSDNGGIILNPVEDTMCLSYVLNASRNNHKLDSLVFEYFNHENIKYEDLCGKGAKQISFDQVHPQDAKQYASEDADFTLRLYKFLKKQIINQKLVSVYETIERPLIKPIVEMENAGIKINLSILNSLSQEFESRLSKLKDKIFELSGIIFNLASPKQLGEVLFEKMNLPGGKKTKSGTYGTSISILEELSSNGFEIADSIIEWRGLAKLKSTYTDSLQDSVNQKTGRVHTSFSMAAASTGRLASTNPNLQNIPVRSTDGKRIRSAFVSNHGFKLLSADYSQIELRLVAHASKEETMIQAFKESKDIHAETAAQVFNLSLNDIDDESRRKAKAINFGIIYGISPFGLSRQINSSQSEAKYIIESYFNKFPGIKSYMLEMKNFAKEHGFVETFFGRKIPIKGINSKNFSERGFAERQAINAPIQGSAADIIKRAMIRVNNRLKIENLKTTMLLQVHDELIFECPEEETHISRQIIKNEMENAHLPKYKISIPLLVESDVGNTWSEAH